GGQRDVGHLARAADQSHHGSLVRNSFRQPYWTSLTSRFPRFSSMERSVVAIPRSAIHQSHFLPRPNRPLRPSRARISNLSLSRTLFTAPSTPASARKLRVLGPLPRPTPAPSWTSRRPRTR